MWFTSAKQSSRVSLKIKIKDESKKQILTIEMVKTAITRNSLQLNIPFKFPTWSISSRSSFGRESASHFSSIIFLEIST